MIVAVVVLVLLLPPAAILLRLTWRIRRRGVPLPDALLSPGFLISVALNCVVYAAAAYAIGLFSAFYFLDPDQFCASRAGFYTGTPGPSDELWRAIDTNYFPIRQTCRWADGTTYDLVPPWVNPLFFTFVAIAWLALLARPLAVLRTRR